MPEPAEMMSAVAESMRERTGRSLDEWVDVVTAAGLDPLAQKDVRAWLRDEHGLKQNTQWAIASAVAERAGWRMPTVDEQVEALYSGRKAPLRPLHDAVVALALSIGSDVRTESRATYVPLVRRTQFCAVAPGPRSTLRIGLRFKDSAPSDERLSPAKGFAQATHWTHLPVSASLDEVDSLEPLLRAAYEQNG